MGCRRALGVVVAVVVVEIIVIVGGGLAIVYSGVYSVAATKPHGKILSEVLDAGMTKSVVHHAAGIPVSATYESPDLAEGYEHFREMCVMCHGAPGLERSEVGDGLYPSPPDLSEAAGDWTPSQLFWIVKNGIKDTGMPAFGPTHSDEKLWNVTAFVKGLPKMTPEQYRSGGQVSGRAEQQEQSSAGETPAGEAPGGAEQHD